LKPFSAFTLTLIAELVAPCVTEMELEEREREKSAAGGGGGCGPGSEEPPPQAAHPVAAKTAK
jgi:hypothetical protein